MNKKQALGKGLSALLPMRPQFEERGPQEQVVHISIGQIIVDPGQFRRNFDEEKLTELAESIRHYGVMQPLLVAETSEGDYRIVAGERRYRAALLLNLTELPCIIRTYSESELAEISLIENIQREDLSALEEAMAYQRLLGSFGYTQEALAVRLGKSRPHITNTLRLLQLAPQYRKLLEDGRLSAGHARTILSLDDPRLQAQLTDVILRNNLSVRQAENLAKDLSEKRKIKIKAASPAADTVHMHDLEKRITVRLGLPAKLSGNLEKGRLVISYQSGDDLDNLIEALLGKLADH